MVERWKTTSLLDREENFRAINGFKHMDVHLVALENDSKPKPKLPRADGQHLG